MDERTTLPPDYPVPPDVLAGLRPELRDALTALRGAVAVLTAADPSALDGQQAAVVAAELASAVSRLGVTQARMLPVVEANGLLSVEARSLEAWVAGRLRVSTRAAHTQVQLGRELRDHLPLTAAAAASGHVTVEHAQALARVATTSEQRLAVLADPDQPCNEAFLVRQATLLPVDHFRALVSRWAAAADPDADDRGYVATCEREHRDAGPAARRVPARRVPVGRARAGAHNRLGGDHPGPGGRGHPDLAPAAGAGTG